MLVCQARFGPHLTLDPRPDRRRPRAHCPSSGRRREAGRRVCTASAAASSLVDTPLSGLQLTRTLPSDALLAVLPCSLNHLIRLRCGHIEVNVAAHLAPGGTLRNILGRCPRTALVMMRPCFDPAIRAVLWADRAWTTRRTLVFAPKNCLRERATPPGPASMCR